jgi:hypothetical protein
VSRSVDQTLNPIKQDSIVLSESGRVVNWNEKHRILGPELLQRPITCPDLVHDESLAALLLSRQLSDGRVMPCNAEARSFKFRGLALFIFLVRITIHILDKLRKQLGPA